MPRNKKGLSQSFSIINNETFQVANESVMGKNIMTQLEEEIQNTIDTLTTLKKKKLDEMEIAFKSATLSMPKDLLQFSFNMNDEGIRSCFLHCNEKHFNISESWAKKNASTTVKKRRSRSVMQNKMPPKVKESNMKTRSSSLDMFKTPAHKVRLTALATASKYTVSRTKNDMDKDDMGISIKRIMRQNEEAISVRGSPLCIQPSIVSIPTVNIPLPGGVVMNIDPKVPKHNIQVPEVDNATRLQIRTLCQKLTTMFDLKD